MKYFLAAYLFLALGAVKAMPLPQRPTNANHPGSETYKYRGVSSERIAFQDRTGTLYTPEGYSSSQPLTLIAFGHGYSAPEFTYNAMFTHLARKGFAVLYVPYDTGLNDEDYVRMAHDFHNFVALSLASHKNLLDPKKVLVTGHSNGALISTMAAGLEPKDIKFYPRALLVFGMAAVPVSYLQRVHPQTLCSFAVGESDTSTPYSISKEAYDKISCQRKQVITIRSYDKDFDPRRLADHGSFRTLGWGGSQEGPLHWYSYWKFLIGAATDIETGNSGTNPWVYGSEVATTGIPGLLNRVERPFRKSHLK